MENDQGLKTAGRDQDLPALTRQMLLAMWTFDYSAQRQALDAIYASDPAWFDPANRSADAPNLPATLEGLRRIMAQVQNWPEDRPGREQIALLCELIELDWKALPYSRHQRSRDKIRAYLEQHPPFAELRVMQLFACARGGAWREGLAAHAEAAREFPDHPLIPAMHARLLLRAGRRAEAEQVLAQAIGRFPDQALLLCKQGELLLEREPKLALQRLQQAQELTPLWPEVGMYIERAHRLQVDWYWRSQRWRSYLPAVLDHVWQWLMIPFESILAHLCDLSLMRQREKADPELFRRVGGPGYKPYRQKYSHMFQGFLLGLLYYVILWFVIVKPLCFVIEKLAGLPGPAG